MQDYFDLDPTQWGTLRRLLDTALDLPVGKRPAWLETLGAEYDNLKPRLRSLLEHAAAGTAALPMATPPEVETAQFLADGAHTACEADPHVDQRIGPYRLLRPLGEGGMGAVWLAERGDMLQRRRVALKLPRLVTGRAALAERMAREREILAALNHPNITRLYDAGITADGQPYLAMEFVEGERIDAYCTRKALDVPAKLHLFLQVARAVAHAHANLVVHRDLKPTNVLVTEAGDVRLLDFGIAKLIEHGQAQETELTQLAGRALTPDYAAPEQILGQPIGTGADVYALGVLLFELLTGSRPYKLSRESRAALEDAILHADAQRPSTVATDAKVRRRLRGDLDAIVLKALKKAPAERYGTVEAFAEDLERFLHQRPVQARPDSEWYRLRTFVARNRFAVASVGSVLLALIIGAALAAWQSRVARTEQARAEQVKELIGAIFQDVDPASRSGSAPVTALDVLAHARQRLDRDREMDAISRADLMQILGQSYWGLGEYRAAEQLSRAALTVGSAVLAGDDARMVRARIVLASSLHPLGAKDEARREVTSVLATLEDPARGDDVKLPQLYVRASLTLATFEINEGRPRSDLALASAQRAVELVDKRRLDKSTALFAHRIMGVVYRWRDRVDQALEQSRLAYETSLSLYGDEGMHARVLEAQNEYGRALARVGRLKEAVALMKLASGRASEIYGPTHVTVQHFAGTLGGLQLELGQIKEGLATLQAAASIDLGDVKVSATYQGSRFVALARAYLAARHCREARGNYAKALNFLAQAQPRGAINWQAEVEHALSVAMDGDPSTAIGLLEPLVQELRKGDAGYLQSALRFLGTAHRQQGNPASALPYLEEAESLLVQINGKPLVSAAHRLALADTRKELGLVRLELGRLAEATTNLNEARRMFATLQEAVTPAHADALIGLARAHLGSGDPHAAEAAARQADEFWREFGNSNPAAGEAAFWHGRSLAALGQAAAAKEAYARAASALAGSPLKGDVRLLQQARAG